MYAIICLPTTERYIGASATLHARRRQHASDLRSGRHQHKGLQAAYSRHGYDAFRWVVLEKINAPVGIIDAVIGRAELRHMREFDTSNPGLLLNKPDIAYRGKCPGDVPGLAAVLRAARESAGMSQAQAGESSGFHHVSIARFETDKATPTLRVLYLLADAYGVKVCDLLPTPARKKRKS